MKDNSHSRTPNRHLAPVVIALALAPACLKAQELEEVVVTGSTSRTQTKLESSVAITTADSNILSREAAQGTADLLEIVPGFWVEDSGGEISNNVAPRGLSGGEAYSFLSLQEDGLPVLYSGGAYYVDYLLRQDVTIERMEAVRGGTSGILTVNGPGALVNFISAKGTETPGGLVKFTTTDYGTLRGDFLYTGPLNDDWLVAVGGFARNSDGIRDTGFTTDQGGQVRLNLTRRLERGQLDFSLRRLDDHNTFFLPIPLQGKGEAIPGLDATSDTLIGADNEKLRVKTPDGDVVRDLTDAIHTRATFIGGALELELKNGWSVNNASRYGDYTIDFTGLFNGGNDTLRTASGRLEDEDVQALMRRFAADGAVAAEYRYASSGERITAPDDLNGNGLVTTSVPRYGLTEAQQFVNDLRFTHETDRNSLTIGSMAFLVDIAASNQDNTIVSEVRDQARRLDIVAIDDAGTVVGQLTDNGFLRYGTDYANGSGDLASYSFYLNNEYQLTDTLRIDGGVRYEHARHRYSVELLELDRPLPGSLDSGGRDSDNIIANNNFARSGSGVYRNFTTEFDEVAWTGGFNYTFNDSLALYGRYADSFQMPHEGAVIGSVGYGRLTSATDGELIDRIGEPTRLRLAELGMRYIADDISLSATVFQTTFEDLRLDIEAAVGGFQQVTIQTETTGIEFEALWQPADYFKLEVAGVVQDALIEGIPANSPDATFNGNQIARTPEVQLRFIPTLILGDFEAFILAHYLDDRFADIGNSIELASYTTIGAGLLYHFGEAVTLQLRGTNLTDEVGLSEGNPRAGFNEDVGGDTFYARPIFGRTIAASVRYNF